MGIKNVLSKEKVVNGLKSLGKLRIKTNHESLLTMSALALILFVAFAVRLFPLKWEIQVGKVHITEFDGYFQYRFAEFVVKNGFVSWVWPTHLVDHQRWYPHGIDYATAAFPGLPFTGALFYDIITALGINIDLMSFCAMLPAFLGTLACFIIYFVGKDVGGKPVGFLAAILLALSASYIQRSQVGWFDDEINGIFALVLFIFLFLRAIENDRPASSSAKYALASSLVLAYFASGWGAAYYPIALTALFTFILLLLRRYTQRLFLSYSLTFGLGLFVAANVPKNGTSYVMSIAVLPTALVFVLLCLSEVLRVVRSLKWRVVFFAALLAALISAFTLLWQFGGLGSIAGKFISAIDPFFRQGSPLIESVAEHRISAWGSIYYDFGIVILFFIAGIFFVLRNLNNRNLFMLVFGLTTLYFGSSMVRLLVLFAPAFALLAGVGIVGIMRPFITLLKEPPKIAFKRKVGQEHVGREFSGLAVVMIFLILTTSLAFPSPKVYQEVNSPVTITAASLPIAPSVPVTEWLTMVQWINNNLESTTVICSWWDYGYWLTVLGNATSLADNATINTTQIENIGFIYMGNETQALKMLKVYNASYILVFTSFDTNGNWIGYGDEGKWMWMARISGNARERFVNNSFIDESSAWSNETTFGKYNSTTNKWVWNDRGKNTTIYELMSFGKHEWLTLQNPSVGDPDTYSEPVYFKEAFFSGKSLTTTDAAKYGNIVPGVFLYEIDWQKYYHDYPNG